MSWTTRRMTAVVALAAAAAIPAQAFAGGIYLPGYGPHAQARAGAYITKAGDLSALVHNPAGLASTRGTMAQVGANFVNMSLSFQRAGQYEPTGEDEEPAYVGESFGRVSDQSDPPVGFAGFQAVPVLGVASDLGNPDSPLRVAAGLVVPYGYPERNFTPEYEFEAEGVAPPPQRYDVMQQNAIKAGPSIAAAYRLTDDLDIGARFTWGVANIEANTYVWGVRNYDEYIGRDGFVEASAWDYFVPNFGAGVTYRPSPSWELAASYASQAKAEAKGEARTVLGSDLEVVPGQPDYIAPETDDWQCAPGGRIDALKTCITFKLPQVAAAGGRWIWRDRGEERADVEFDVVWENWSSGTASEYILQVDGKSGVTGLPLQEQRLRHHFRDTLSFRLGGSYAFPLADKRLIASAGGAYDTAAAPERYTRLDIDGAARTTLGAGLAYVTSNLRVDLGGGAVIQPDRTVQGCQTSTAQPSCEGSGDPEPVAERDNPDPLQPLRNRNSQFQSPFNAGEYSSGYVLFSLGVTTWF